MEQVAATDVGGSGQGCGRDNEQGSAHVQTTASMRNAANLTGKDSDEQHGHLAGQGNQVEWELEPGLIVKGMRVLLESVRNVITKVAHKVEWVVRLVGSTVNEVTKVTGATLVTANAIHRPTRHRIRASVNVRGVGRQEIPLLKDA